MKGIKFKIDEKKNYSKSFTNKLIKVFPSLDLGDRFFAYSFELGLLVHVSNISFEGLPCEEDYETVSIYEAMEILPTGFIEK